MIPNPLHRPAAAICGLLLALAFAANPLLAQRKSLDLRYSAIELPGSPSRIVATDLNGDGRRDLAIVVAYTHWQQLGYSEVVEMDEVAGLVETLTVVPALFDRRELHLFLANPAEPGKFATAGAPLTLDTRVHAIEAGPTGMPLIALTDEGLDQLVWADTAGGGPRFETYLSSASVLAATGQFVGKLDLVHDLDGDGRTDLLFPSESGLEVYLNPPPGLDKTPRQRLEPATDDHRFRDGDWLRRYPIPLVRDINGDRLPDLLFPGHATRWKSFWVLRGLGGGAFDGGLELEEKRPGSAGQDDKDQEPIHFGDLDGDGRAEWVTRQDLGDEDAGLRKGLEEARKPPSQYRFYRSDPKTLRMAAEPYFEMAALGYTVDNGDEEGIFIPGGFQDLDGNGRQDLIAVTLEFSMMQAVRILATKSINIGLDFSLFCQTNTGSFVPVAGLDLSGKFRLDLENLKVGNLSLFSGDFDGDGKADFVQLGRGRKMTIHRGQTNCRFPTQPDLTLDLFEEPRDLALVRIEDLDADGASDLWVLQPGKTTEPGVSPKTRLDLYLSGGAR